MSSFYAELHVEGAAYRVVHCAFACHQDVAARGRVQAKVRFEPMQLVLDVPMSDVLLDWATTPHKPLSGEVVFHSLAQQATSETIAFEAGECVAYTEQFASSATGDGAYVCHLTIAATKFELRAGGPAGVEAVATVAANQAALAPSAAETTTIPVDAWLIDLEGILGASNNARLLIASWTANGLDERKIKSAFRSTVDKQLLFERLRDAKRGIFQQRVVLDDYAAVPGVAKKDYIPNGLPSKAIPASDFGVSDPDFDLPAWNALTFTASACLIEIKPGQKLYRVTNDPISEPFAKTGGYWTHTPPADLAEVIGGTAVMPEWNNFQRVYEFTAPPYADPIREEPKFYAWEGPAATQAVSGDYKEKIANGHCLPGGTTQLFVPNKLARDKSYNFGQHITDVTAIHKVW